MEVDSTFIAKWIEALRSGKYRQGKGYLFIDAPDDDVNGKAHCCIGVACDLIDHDGWINIAKDQFVADEFQDEYIYDPVDTVWNRYSNDQLELPWLERDAAGKLADWNDHGVSFNQIADRIEQMAYVSGNIIHLKDDAFN